MADIVFGTALLVIQALERLGIAYALCGGLALQPWGRLRSTMDVDLLLSVDDDAVERIREELIAVGFQLRRPPLPLGGVLLVQMQRQDSRIGVEVPVDFLVARSDYHAQVVARAQALLVQDAVLQVVSVEDLILLKLVANRPIDRLDVQDLAIANRDQIDTEYLRKWSQTLGVVDPLEELVLSSM